jgi:hypothetical protein
MNQIRYVIAAYVTAIVWIEAATRRRGDDGRFRRKEQTDPPAQLVLNFGKEAA